MDVPNRMRILVVEDEVVTAEMTAALLRMEGHEVQVAPDGPTALRLAQADPPDVALIDISLPGADGYEVARQLRELKTPKRPLFIVATGHGGDDYRRRSAAEGIDLHLTKPFEPEKLQQVLRRFRDIISPAREDHEGEPPG